MRTKAEKQGIVEELATLFKKSRLLIFSDPTRIPTKEIRIIRSQLSKRGAVYQVVKKTLLKLALEKANIQELRNIDIFKGSVAVLALPEVDIEAVKVLYNLAKSSKDKFQFWGGWLATKVLSQSDVKELAILPAKEILLGQLVRVLAAPLRNLSFILQANTQKLLLVLGRPKEA